MFDLRHTLELIDDGALDEAITALQRAIAQMPAYTPAYVLLAEAYEAQDRWAKALATWQQARFFAPNSPTVEAGLLRALEHQDIVPEAVVEDDAIASPDDVMERMADEWLDTLQDDAPPAGDDSDEPAPPPADENPPVADTLEPAPTEPPAEEPPAEEPPAEVPSPSRAGVGEELDTEAPASADDAAANTDVEDSTLEAIEPEGTEMEDTEVEDPTADPIEPPAPPPSSQSEPAPDESATAASEIDEDDAATVESDEEPSATEPSSDEAAAPPDAPETPSAHPRPSPLDELASRMPDSDQTLPEDVQDLDRLIDELEGARIDPQPDVEGAPEPNLDSDVDDMVSETLARIYIAQQQYTEAARVYVRLAHQDPDRADEYRERAAELREQARDADQ